MGWPDATALDALPLTPSSEMNRGARGGDDRWGHLVSESGEERRVGLGWVASGVRWAWPLGFSFSDFSYWLALLLLFPLLHNLF